MAKLLARMIRSLQEGTGFIWLLLGLALAVLLGYEALRATLSL